MWTTLDVRGDRKKCRKHSARRPTASTVWPSLKTQRMMMHARQSNNRPRMEMVPPILRKHPTGLELGDETKLVLDWLVTRKRKVEHGTYMQ